jgi:aryl-alcohol dehydrogenase-like predicted oxidoreductase
MLNIQNKICIGTAQLGMKYGISSNNQKMRESEFKRILNYSKKNKICFIDTAQSYGDSEILIGKYIKKKKDDFHLITKINNIRSVDKKNIFKTILQRINRSIKKLKVKKIYALLLHDINDLKSKKNKEIFIALKKIKKMQLVEKIGFSCYETKDIIKYIKIFDFDLIQFPFNVFDQRILNKKVLSVLKKKKIEIHIRSIFLQGLLLMPINSIPIKFKKYFILFKWRNFLRRNNIDDISACLNFVLKYNFYSKIVIGFNSYSQFKEVIKKCEFQKKMNKFLKFNSLQDSSSLINPSKWKYI